MEDKDTTIDKLKKQIKSLKITAILLSLAMMTFAALNLYNSLQKDVAVKRSEKIGMEQAIVDIGNCVKSINGANDVNTYSQKAMTCVLSEQD